MIIMIIYCGFAGLQSHFLLRKKDGIEKRKGDDNEKTTVHGNFKKVTTSM